jgi:hypothetical protein
LEATDTHHSPWCILPSDDKRRARLNCISFPLGQIPYQELLKEKIKLPKRSKHGEYDDAAAIRERRFVANRY